MAKNPARYAGRPVPSLTRDADTPAESLGGAVGKYRNSRGKFWQGRSRSG
ncbi:hypothetical protein QUB05_18040 [Microcoleus sp. F10-C6]